MIRLGTDCSGIEAPIHALNQMNIPYSHEFSSEVDTYCIKSIKANYSPKILYGDISDRNSSDLPDIDLYVAGFPCQPFSTAGKRKGFDDKRGSLFWSCLDVIKTKNPRYFVLENVRGLLSHDGENTWNTMLEALDKLPHNIYYKVINTSDYGIPQDRKRLYIVGSLLPFKFPDPIPLHNLYDYVDDDNDIYQSTSSRHEEILLRVPDESIYVELAFGVSKTRSFINADVMCPCITANTRIWCVPYHRYASTRELLSLQGFGEFKQVVSDSRLKKQIGNSMSVNVLKYIFSELLKSDINCVGL